MFFLDFLFLVNEIFSETEIEKKNNNTQTRTRPSHPHTQVHPSNAMKRLESRPCDAFQTFQKKRKKPKAWQTLRFGRFQGV